MSTFLIIFLIIDVFVIGMLSPIAYRHWQEHYKPSKKAPEKPELPVNLKEHMLHESQEQLQTVLEKSVGDLQHDLESTTDQINNLIKQFAGEIVGDELGRYRAELAKLHKQADADMSSIKEAIAGHQTEVEAQVATIIETEKQFLLKQIDTKLADAVGSFLVEALQHNVDLGSQEAYLVQLLEEHKADFASEVKSES